MATFFENVRKEGVRFVEAGARPAYMQVVDHAEDCRSK
jgi:hypothetical protein